MGLSAIEIEDFLLADLRSIVAETIRLYELRYERGDPALEDPLYRWMDFALRFVAPLPRPLIRAKRFSNALPTEAERALAAFESLSRTGCDLNPYQGKGLIRWQDISGVKKAQRTDALWADWDVLHFHLTEAPIAAGAYFSKRSEWLLFGIVLDKAILALDVRHHHEPGVFEDQTLIINAIESWPTVFAPALIRGSVEIEQTLSRSELKMLRRAGVNVVNLVVEGKLYASPGMGLSTALTPVRVGTSVDFIRRGLRQLAQTLADDPSFLPASATGSPHRMFITQAGLALHSQGDRWTHLLPRSNGPASSPWAQAHSLVLPDWALARVAPMLPSLDTPTA